MKLAKVWVCGWAESYTTRGVRSPIEPCSADFPHSSDWRCGFSYTADTVGTRKREDAPRTPYDDLPLEVRRLNWGWFGDPWPSGVCYDEDGRLIEEMRKPFPEGEDCLYCTERFQPGDSGNAMPFVPASGDPVIRHVHKECMLCRVAGSLAHLQGTCSCQGGDGTFVPGELTLREEALAVWDWVQRHGVTR